MRLTLRRGLLILAALAGGGLLFAWSGLFNVAASGGHWPITDWFLHWVMRSSVRTQALGIEVPELSEPAMVQRGAGHFAAGCAPCHGAPGQPQSAVVTAMTPPPPALAERIAAWQPNQLFWIVRHGIKYTGMPAWPATGRDDEVWAVVAFLLRLPELDDGTYRRLAFGDGATAHPLPPDTATLERLLPRCNACHGPGRAPATAPALAGQSGPYLAATLGAYAERRRGSGIMQLAADGLTPAAIAELAAYYAGSQAGSPPAAGTDLALLTEGEQIARRGAPASGVPACASCHDAVARYPAYPALAGQTAAYLAGQLALFQSGARGGTAYSHIMAMIASRLDGAQIAAVSAYYASQPSRQRAAALP